jgi:hypothetical protein
VRRRTLTVAALVLALAGALGLERGGAGTTLVTLNVGHFKNANGVLVTVFSGTVSSNASGEVVDVLGRDCGAEDYRLISGTHTRAGGGWRVENPAPDSLSAVGTQVWSGITYRARWKGELSEPRVWAHAARLSVKKVGRLAWRVHTEPPPPGTVSMRGKPVELQRRIAGEWRTTARKPLVYKPRLRPAPGLLYGSMNHEVVFKVARRGWTLRASLPPRSAAPCFLAGVTVEWRS